MRTIGLLVVACMAAALPACGQKGPLVLPDAQHPHKRIGIGKPAAPPAPAPTPDGSPPSPTSAPPPSGTAAPENAAPTGSAQAAPSPPAPQP